MDVLQRFLDYVKFDTKSDEHSETVPSTAKQRVLGERLVQDLTDVGLVDVGIDDCGYVYGVLPATDDCKNLPALGLVAHMDTSPDVSGANVRPQIVTYQGGDLKLSDTVTMAVQDFPFLQKYVGQDLIVTDGTTLLGSDDKAGVAEIVSACAYLVEHPELSHRAIAVCFTPDEEIGRGADHFDYNRFAAKEAYTVDGGEVGEIEYENFNGASALVTVHGVNIHPGSAKNKMKNAVLIAAEFIGLLPPAEIPAHTEGYEGFYHVHDVAGNESEATVALIIRDHDRTKFEARKAFVTTVVEYLNKVYGAGTVELQLQDSYYNMKEKILPAMHLIDNAKRAMELANVTPQIVAIRGGTDGARLSYEGLPCPNLSTGGFNFHSIHEGIPVNALHQMVQVLVNLVTMK